MKRQQPYGISKTTLKIRVSHNTSKGKMVFMKINIWRTLLIPFVLFFVIGCSSPPSQTLNEKIFEEYVKNNRAEKYHELYEQYDGIKAVLWLNTEEDVLWITNFTLWLIISLLPDLPDTLAAGGVIAIIYGVAWWIRVTLTGGGILAVLAKLGSVLGVIPGISPAIMGIIYLGVIFALFQHIFGLLL